ncbi:hypothetical protein SDC9_200096 [bioreactor metagenome]|uniref:Uncharacterized protein n=1 Tax=bioreactor metagenome TaxID=1076179 RepID=A0A645IM83_9ZZZZ
MRDVQTGHHHRNPRLEDDFCGFRVDIDIEFGGRRPVAQPHRAAHDHDTGDFVTQFRMAVQ